MVCECARKREGGERRWSRRFLGSGDRQAGRQAGLAGSLAVWQQRRFHTLLCMVDKVNTSVSVNAKVKVKVKDNAKVTLDLGVGLYHALLLAVDKVNTSVSVKAKVKA